MQLSTGKTSAFILYPTFRTPHQIQIFYLGFAEWVICEG